MVELKKNKSMMRIQKNVGDFGWALIVDDFRADDLSAAFGLACAGISISQVIYSNLSLCYHMVSLCS